MFTDLKKYAPSILLGLLLLSLGAVIITLIMTIQPMSSKNENVGVIFYGPVTDGRWNAGQYASLKKACVSLGLHLVIRENVGEGAETAIDAVKELADENCGVIFITLDGYGDDLVDVIASYPDIVFYTISSKSDAPNMTSYYSRMYQLRYITGMIAGRATETNVLGYVAALDNPQSCRELNAFVLGARAVNPDAVVKVFYTHSWSDREKDAAAAQFLINEQHADVIAHHTNTAAAVEAAEASGVYSIGYLDAPEGLSERFLTGIRCNWNVPYLTLLQDYINGNVNNKEYYWWDASDGTISLSEFSPLVAPETVAEAERILASYENGWDVFIGEIHRNDGTVMCRSNERISDKALIFHMDWLVEGVEVYE